MKLASAACAVALVSFPAAAVTQASDSGLFGRLAGDWAGEGRFQGAPSVVRASWAPLMDGGHYRLDIHVEASPEDGRVIRFEGIAHYDVRGTYAGDGYWIDSQGSSYPIEFAQDGDALEVLWGPNGGFEGKSVYTLARETLTIADYIKNQQGEWQEFANATLTRED